MNHKKKIYRKFLIVFLIIDIVAIYRYSILYISNNIPDNIMIMIGREDSFDFGLPCDIDFSEESVGAISVDNKKLDENSLNIEVQDSFNISASQKGEYNANIKLFGILNLKDVKVKVIDETNIIPGGIPIGIYVDTQGILVLGTGDITCKDGSQNSPSNNIIRSGDYIIAVNGDEVKEKSQLIKVIQNAKKDRLEITLRRNNEKIKVAVNRVLDSDNTYKIGIWVRDNMQGIGMLTFVTEDDEFGALGHGVNDIDTGLLMNISDGYIYNARIIDIVKGEAGTPGELVGIINHDKDNLFGNILMNTKDGIYGEISTEGKKRIIGILKEKNSFETMEIGLKQEIHEGDAILRTQINNEIKEYEIEIENVNKNSSANEKDFVVKIVDDELLEKSNGIVQGMSGSPIIQDDKVIGALTHVLVNNPKKGYGIFIEKMLSY